MHIDPVGRQHGDTSTVHSAVQIGGPTLPAAHVAPPRSAPSHCSSASAIPSPQTDPVPEDPEEPAVVSVDVDALEVSADAPVVTLDGPEEVATVPVVPAPASSIDAVDPEDVAPPDDVVAVSPGAAPSSPDGSEKQEARAPTSARIDRGRVLTG